MVLEDASNSHPKQVRAGSIILLTFGQKKTLKSNIY